MTQEYTLSPIDGRKSFNGKCIVIDDKKTAQLQSYDTIVAVYDHDTKQVTINGWYSQTTARHIRAFLSHFNKPTNVTKHDMQEGITL